MHLTEEHIFEEFGLEPEPSSAKAIVTRLQQAGLEMEPSRSAQGEHKMTLRLPEEEPEADRGGISADDAVSAAPTTQTDTELPPPPNRKAGWYPDPENPSAARRYWDGEQWSESRAPVEAEASGPRNGMAVTAFVLGLVGAVLGLIIAVIAYPIPLALGIAAVPLGLIARRRAKKNPGVGRKGLATWAVVLGLLSVTWGIIGAVAFNNAVNDLDKSLSSHCLSHPNAPDCPK